MKIINCPRILQKFGQKSFPMLQISFIVCPSGVKIGTVWRQHVNTSGHSGMHPKPSCVRRLSFFGFGSSFWSVHKIFGMSKNCRRSSRSCTFAWTSCALLVHRVAIVRPSCVHPVGSCGHRLYSVWPSATPGIFSTRWQYDGHTEFADDLGKATRRREAFA